MKRKTEFFKSEGEGEIGNTRDWKGSNGHLSLVSPKKTEFPPTRERSFGESNGGTNRKTRKDEVFSENKRHGITGKPEIVDVE